MKKVFKVVGVVVAFAMALMFVGCSGITGDEKLSEPGLINGKVVYSNSSDNSDIVVTIEKSDVLASTTVSADGHYSFADLEPGTYTVSASSSNSAEKAIQTNVTVLAGRTVTVKDLQLTATGKISGKIILDTTDLDKSGFLVIIPGTGIVDVTNEKGEYTLADVPAGTDYNLVVVYGTFKYFITEKVSTAAGQTATASNINLKVEDIKKELLTGNDGKDGTDGTDGKDGVDGLSINWLGTFKDVKEIEEPKTYDAYFNSTDGNSYIYIEKTWKILAGSGLAGEDGKDGQDGKDLEGISTGGAEKLTYVSAVATEKGIKFSGTILSNISSNEYSNSAQAVIEIQDIDADMYMHQDWKKSSSAWDSWELTYPFVEEGKEYNFRVRASCTNWTMYEEFITITAIGGLGEYQSTNREDLKAELTKDKVLKRIGTSEFTKNEKVQILKTGTKFDFYRDGAWQTWVYDTILWDDGKGELDLQKQLPSWQNFERVNNLMSGHKYWGRIHTYIKVAGYTYNDTVYFQMNDFAYTEDDWGGEVQKVYVITDPKFVYGEGIDFEDIPGEEVEWVLTGKSEDGKEEKTQTFKFKTIVINYGDSIKEPTNSPYVKNAAKSEFNYWMNGNSKISFPYAPTTENGYGFKPDGEPVNFLAFMVPDMSIYYNATLMDGDKEIGKSEYILGKGIFYTPKKEGYLFVGWYTDKDCTKDFKYNEPGDVTLYAKFVEAETVWTGSESSVYGLLMPDDITFDIGDTLYFEIKNERSYSTSDELSIQASSSGHRISYDLEPGETEIISLTVEDASEARSINTNGINVETDWYDIRVKNIYYVKGPRVNVKIYDGKNLFDTIEVAPDSELKLNTPLSKKDCVFNGLYVDSDCSELWDYKVGQKDVTVYASFVQAEKIWTGSSYTVYSSDISSEKLSQFDVGDSLYFEIYGGTSGDYQPDWLSLSSSLIEFDVKPSETILVKKVLTANYVNSIKNNFSASLHWSFMKIKNIYYAKGPRVNVKIYDGTTLLQTIEAVPNRDVKVPMIRKNTSIIQGLYTDSSLENAWDYVTDKDISVYAKWEELPVPGAEAAGNDVSKYTVVSFSGKRSRAFMYFLEAGSYYVEWNDSCNKGPFADLDNINFTDCYIGILNENGESLYSIDDYDFEIDITEAGVYSIILEGRNSDMQEAAFHIYSYSE